MLNSVMIDVALGMVFIFLMLSFVVSAIREAIEARLKTRAKFLAYGIRQIFDKPELTERFFDHPAVQSLYGGTLTEKDKQYFKDSPGGGAFTGFTSLVHSLMPSAVKLPSYVPSRTFALTVIDLVNSGRLFANPPAVGAQAPGAVADGVPAMPPPGPNQITLQTLKELLEKNPNDTFARSLSTVLTDAGNDLNKAIASIENWYDASMDRVSGWYKRESQKILFTLGLLVSIALNVDALLLIKHLAGDENSRKSVAALAIAASTDQTVIDKLKSDRDFETVNVIKNREILKQLRDSFTKLEAEINQDKSKSVEKKQVEIAALQAEYNKNKEKPEKEEKEGQAEIAKTIIEADKRVHQEIRRLNDLNLPIGWTSDRFRSFSLLRSDGWMTVLGWFITAFGLSFGAPFWFDILNRIMIIRSTVKPHEKSPEEPSQDNHK